MTSKRTERESKRSTVDHDDKSKSPIRNKRMKTMAEARKVKFHQEPGYHYRLVNDEGDRITMFLEAGYEFVEDPNSDGSDAAQQESQHGNRIRKVVNNDPLASARYGYLMRIPQEFHDEDKRLQQEQLTRDTDFRIDPKNIANADYGTNRDVK